MSSLLVTGGAGFIGSNFIRLIRRLRPEWRIVNLDALTYAGNLANLDGVEQEFVKGDITNPDDVRRAFEIVGKGARVVHFAAESHVDRSIRSSQVFLDTNIVGTQNMIDAAREFEVQRFLHISTDEVYGSLAEGTFATELARLNPSNPYAASKAASDHLVLAAVNTHGLPAMITRCSNNYGRYQFPEKFIPLMIANAMEKKSLPIYGDGLYVRDWIHVDDHGEAVLAVLEGGAPGEIYNVSGNITGNVAGSSHRTNLEVVKFLLNELGADESLLETVADRPGHDRRYAPDDTKIRTELGFEPTREFNVAMRETIDWYRNNGAWLDHVRSGEYLGYYAEQYGS